MSNCSLFNTTIAQYTAVPPTIGDPKQFMLTNRESFMSGAYNQSTGYLSPVNDYLGNPQADWGIEPCWAPYLRKLSVNGIAVWEFTAPHNGQFQFYIGQSTLNYSSVYGSALSSPPTSGYTTQSTGNNAHILINPQSMSTGNVIYFTFATSFWGYDSGSTGGAGTVAAWFTAPPSSASVDFTVRGMDASHNTLVTDSESTLIDSSKTYRVNVEAIGVDHWGWSANSGAETMMPAGSTYFTYEGDRGYNLTDVNGNSVQYIHSTNPYTVAGYGCQWNADLAFALNRINGTLYLVVGYMSATNHGSGNPHTVRHPYGNAAYLAEYFSNFGFGGHMATFTGLFVEYIALPLEQEGVWVYGTRERVIWPSETSYYGSSRWQNWFGHGVHKYAPGYDSSNEYATRYMFRASLISGNRVVVDINPGRLGTGDTGTTESLDALNCAWNIVSGRPNGTAMTNTTFPFTV